MFLLQIFDDWMHRTHVFNNVQVQKIKANRYLYDETTNTLMLQNVLSYKVDPYLA